MFKKIFNAIFVISGVLASFWNLFIKFCWHGQNTSIATVFAPSNKNKSIKGVTFTNRFRNYCLAYCTYKVHMVISVSWVMEFYFWWFKMSFIFGQNLTYNSNKRIVFFFELLIENSSTILTIPVLIVHLK